MRDGAAAVAPERGADAADTDTAVAAGGPAAASREAPEGEPGGPAIRQAAR